MQEKQEKQAGQAVQSVSGVQEGSGMPTDLAIAGAAKMEPIEEIAKSLGVKAEEIESYGRYKAKIGEEKIREAQKSPRGKLVLVTAVNPTPAGEGKTTVSIGLADALRRRGKKAVLALREPSLGPVFGLKGGAAGGGYAQVVPMEDINLHFTGDIHAITAAHNLLCALVDNHVQQGNALRIDPRTVQIKRVMDVNDRALRQITIGLGGKVNGVPREDGFQITVSCETMAILCLAEDLGDLKERLGNILCAYTTDGKPVFARDLGAQGAMTVLLRDAMKPNLVQTLEHTPAFVHGGPFANIAHGCNSLRATKLAMALGEICVTEAGFGADLGAEKFFDIKCRAGSLYPDCAVLVATIRALKYNGGVPKTELDSENLEALKNGLGNFKVHVENLKKFGVPVVAAINRFHSDTEREEACVRAYCEELGVACAVCEVYERGSAGGEELARAVCEVLEQGKARFRPLYEIEKPIEEKIETVAREIYRAGGVDYTKKAKSAIERIEEAGYRDLPVCIAKTQYSLSDDLGKLGVPGEYRLTVRDVTLSAGAGFIVVYTGEILTMPGLPKAPAALGMDCDESGVITGLF